MDSPLLKWQNDSAPAVAGFRCTRVETSPTNSVAVIRVEPETVAGLTTEPPSPLGELIRLVRDRLSALGWSAPLVAVLRPGTGGSEAEDLRRCVDAWGADQDWSRGEFLLAVASADDDEEASARFFLASAASLRRDVPMISTSLDVQAWAANIRQGFEEYPPELRDLGERVTEGLLRANLDQSLSSWGDDVIQRAKDEAHQAEDEAKRQAEAQGQEGNDEP